MAISVVSKQLSIFDVYPVGAIYISTVSISPADLFGGTWEQIQDRMLLGAGTSYTAGSTGGAATHTLITDELPSHNHTFTGSSATSGNQSVDHTHTYTDYYATTTGGTAISVSQMASHTHGVQYGAAVYNVSCESMAAGSNYTSLSAGGSSGWYLAYTGSGSAHSHTGVNTSAVRTSDGISANHTHTLTAAGSIGNTGSGTAFSVMNPYLVVYMWKRIA